MKNLLWLAAGSALIWGSNLLGLWQMTVVAGALFAVLLPGTGRAVLYGLIAGMIGWEGPLAVAMLSGQILELAGLLGNILGLGAAGKYVAFLLPAIIGGLLALSGAWITGSVKAILVSRRQFVSVGQPVQQ